MLRDLLLTRKLGVLTVPFGDLSVKLLKRQIFQSLNKRMKHTFLL